MTAYAFHTDIKETAATTNAINIASGDYAYIAQGVSIAATASNAYGVKGSDHDRVTVEGDVFGGYMGISLNGSDGLNRVLISESGSVAGLSYGIYQTGSNNTVANAGTVAGSSGLAFTGTEATVFNTGQIWGEVYGILFNGIGGTNRLVNSGVLFGTNAIASGVDAADTIINTGRIVGTVDLGGGSDLFDSRGGTVVGAVDLGGGNDKAYGGDGADNILGGLGSDWIRGRLDDDRLDGGLGKDKLIGGVGEDEFRFTTALGSGNVDTLADFVHGEDLIVLGDGYFNALGASVSSSEFVARASGHTATNSSQHLIYDKAKGTLWYDFDGKGGVAAVKFAQLGTASDHPTDLTYKDFAITEIIV